MHLIDNGTQVASLPSPRTAVGTPGYAFNGDPGAGTPTIWDADIANTLIEEIRQVIAAASITLSRTNNAQLLAALRKLCGGPGSLGTNGYMPLAGGLILVWGQYTGTTDATGPNVFEVGVSVTWATSLTNVYGGVASALDVSGSQLQEQAWIATYTLSGSYVGMNARLACRQASTAMTGFYMVLGS